MSSVSSLGGGNLPATGWVRAMRDLLGISSYELARRMGVSQSTVMQWERGEVKGTITLNSLRRLAEALESDVAYLLVPRDEEVRKRQRGLIKSLTPAPAPGPAWQPPRPVDTSWID